MNENVMKTGRKICGETTVHFRILKKLGGGIRRSNKWKKKRKESTRDDNKVKKKLTEKHTSRKQKKAKGVEANIKGQVFEK